MANSRKTPQKTGTLTEFPQPENAVGVADPPETSQPSQESNPTPETPTEAAKRGRGHPRKTDPPVETDFFQRVAAVSTADWGTRVYLYLYQLEPVCDLKQSGGKSYLMRYQEPVRDEHQIMLEQGSGKYRFVLAYNKVSPLASNEMARYEFEIYNPQYPPKIPRTVWIADPRNKRWEALLPPEVIPQPATPLGTFVDVMRATNDIRREIKEEMAPDPSATPPQQTQPAPVDPWTAAEKILNMRSENPMVAILQQQQADAAKALEAERERNFKRDEAARQREYDLQQKLIEAKGSAPQPKGIVEQLKELASISDSLTPLKALFGFGNGNGAAEPVRAGRTGTLDVLQTLGSKFFESDLASGVGQWLGAMAQRSVQGNGAPHTMANPGTQVQQQTDQQSFDAFVRDVLNPALLRQYSQGFTGADFAGWLYDAFPDRLKQLQSFTHPMAPGLKGAAVIIGAYRRTPHIWNPIVAQREGEPSFVQFVNEFCQWKPEDSSDGVIDAEIVPDGDQGEDSPERIS